MSTFSLVFNSHLNYLVSLRLNMISFNGWQNSEKIALFSHVRTDGFPLSYIHLFEKFPEDSSVSCFHALAVATS